MPSPKRPLDAVLAGLVLTIFSSACATSTSPLVRQQCYNADRQLASVLQPLETLRAHGCVEGSPERANAECDRLRQELDRLAVICPAHAPTLMANAVIAYEDERRPAKSQQLLDQILAQSRAYPDAAVLRARIALEEGNVPYAHRLLEQQIRLAPDHAGLHETYAATLFLERRLPETRNELTRAGALGAPAWRISYHLGLLEETLGRFDEARRHYADALMGNPGWAQAQSRLNGLAKP